MANNVLSCPVKCLLPDASMAWVIVRRYRERLVLRRPSTVEPAGAAGSVTVIWETSEPYQVRICQQLHPPRRLDNATCSSRLCHERGGTRRHRSCDSEARLLTTKPAIGSVAACCLQRAVGSLTGSPFYRLWQNGHAHGALRSHTCRNFGSS